MVTLLDRKQSLVAPLAPRRANRPLRVALFSGNYDCVRDGANQALNRLVDHLQTKQGATVRVYSPRARVPAFAAVGDIRGVRSLGLPGRSEYRLALGLTRAARTDLDDFAPDIIHLSAPDWLGWQALAYARGKGIPSVASLHTRFETYADYYGLSFLRKPIERYLDRFYGRCDRILAPTQPIAKELAVAYGEKVAIWGRGVDRSRFHPDLRSDEVRAKYGYAPDDIVVLFFGRLVLEKGLDVFAETIALLRDRNLTLRPDGALAAMSNRLGGTRRRDGRGSLHRCRLHPGLRQLSPHHESLGRGTDIVEGVAGDEIQFGSSGGFQRRSVLGKHDSGVGHSIMKLSP